MRSPTLILLLLQGLLLQGQNTVRPAPNWQVGDHRRMTMTTDIELELSPEMKLTASGRTDQHLDVVSANKERFVLRLRMAPDSDLPGSMDLRMKGEGGAVLQATMDSVQLLMKKLLAKVQAPLRDHTFDFAITRSGEVEEHLETPQQEAKTKAAVSDMMADLLKTLGAEQGGIDRTRMAHVVDSLYGAYKEVQVNSMSRLLEIHHYDLPTSGSDRLPAMIQDVQAPLSGKFSAMAGTIELGLDELTPKQLTARIITTYDPDSLFAEMVLEMPDLQREGLSLIEESVHTLDRKSGWLLRSSTITTLRSKTMRYRMLEKMVLAP